MNEPPELQVEVRRWVEKADHDLRNAGHVLNLTQDCPTDTVCFHCQQCAEKYLKALLLSRGIDFPKTHDLVVLFNLAAGAGRLALQIEQVQPLNRYAVETRYPGDWDPIDHHEACEALRMARGVQEAVRNVLPGNAVPDDSQS